jgi:signal peptidase II
MLKAVRNALGVVANPAMWRFGLILAVSVFVLDQVSKVWVLEGMAFSTPECLASYLAHEPAHATCGRVPIIGPVFNERPLFSLTMVWNTGVSFGMLRAGDEIGRWLLIGLSLVIAGVFLVWLRSSTRRMQSAALGLVIGGALGNVIDRFRFGAVADFLDFYGLYFPWVFNVADAAITIGAGLIFLDFLLNGEDKTAAAPQKGPGGAPAKGPDQA